MTANPTPGGSNGSPNGSGTPADESRQGSASPPSLPNVNGSGNAVATPPLGYNPNIIWITGEFFNVSRARDALFQLAAVKVRVRSHFSFLVFDHFRPGCWSRVANQNLGSF